MNVGPTELPRQLATTVTMARVATLILATGIVKQCKQRNNFEVRPHLLTHSMPIGPNSSPMNYAMFAMRRKLVLLQYDLQDCSKIVLSSGHLLALDWRMKKREAFAIFARRE
jgi:hypothetical protein